ncbi:MULTISPECIES: LysR family transcriptional regulator [Lysinibacillus]|uniref:LysR family transcriptional regulator n=3 Tax=Lysinibacillus TaxID=400634 RepID=A0A2I0V010_9BACI|nr:MULTISPECIES: LysR family transcriptional regulator [Lysinibacillus]PKU51596.1 LysR family transcriptional regulator [Lysinibacillus fusiformis]WCH45876.1 LysR family transcriptional regulator [Lysinibacillus sp. OF-1]SCY36924.1 DNA-binding transcriptional regulator, LysR family [Lysinibacillus sp. SG9]SDB18390.1 DNA-binding transcriptional regulator, LysR family [Lysinibacillus sp. TC-37]SFS66267.1 DNA-binding transcriptional regulator, LysR family [Lysinibacillus sp. SG55]
MEIRQLKTFWTLASTRSFSRTAEVLNYVPSTVTMQIKALEEELGVRLLDRLGKSVVLTDAGHQLLPYATKILNDIEEARCVSSQNGELTGTIIIGADEVLCTYRLPALLRDYRQQYPHVRLLFKPLSGQNLKQSLREGDVDVVFMLDEPIVSSDLHTEILLDEPFLMVVSPDHPLASRATLSIEDFNREHILLSEKGCSYRTFFYRTLVKNGADSLTELEFNSVEAIKQCTMAGLGIALLPKMALKGEMERGELIPLPWDLSEIQFATQMLWHQEKWISPSIKAFTDLARNLLQ